MSATRFAKKLWYDHQSFITLMIAAIIMLFAALGSRELWTQEHRWAEIVSGMFYRQDFLHPFLGNTAYYDKPLLSYWLIIFFIKLAHGLSAWALRLPSACAGLLAVYSIYRMGSLLKDKTTGLLAGWMLLTTYYFVFWSRVSSADMLNMAGTFFAVSWYVAKREQNTFSSYLIFWIILSVTSLCKGLTGAIVPLIAVVIDLYLRKTYRAHINAKLFISIVPALILYFFPFWLSNYHSDFNDNGLSLVFRENFIRYFQPFDHQDPIYTYFIFLPLYLLPWTPLFIYACYESIKKFPKISLNAKWLLSTLFFIFLFFTLSGSRRNYYVLPLVPFALLFTALLLQECQLLVKKEKWILLYTLIAFSGIFFVLDLFPAWYYQQYGIQRFVTQLKREAIKIRPWHEWNIVTLDAISKNNYYLNLPPGNPNYHIKGIAREHVKTESELLRAFPILKEKPHATLFVTRERYAKLMQKLLPDYRVIRVTVTSIPILKNGAIDETVAFIPQR